MINQTLKKLAIPNLKQQPLYIVYHNLEVGFKHKSRLIHLLPIFLDFFREEPNE